MNHLSEDVKIKLVKENYNNLQYIKNPTERVLLKSVEQNSEAIKYIKNPTEEMKLEEHSKD